MALNFLINKKDDFEFLIVRMSHLTSIIPSELLYSVFGAKIFQTACNTSK